MQTNSEHAMKPHAVCIPYPSQGHIIPMMSLAKLLHSTHGFHITFVHTDHTRRRFLHSQGPHALTGLPSFRFETIPDGLPPCDPATTQSIPEFCKAAHRNCTPPFKELLRRLKDGAGVTCVVVDGVLPFAVKAAVEVGLEVVVIWTASACGFEGYAQIPRLVQMGFVPLKDPSYLSNGYLDTPIDWIPSMNGARLKDMPQFIRTTDPDDVMLAYMQSVIATSRKASAIIINTFDAMEGLVLASLTPDFPPLYPIGPLHLLKPDHSLELGPLHSNLWAEEAHSIEWLDTMPPSSVLYVSLGSIAVVTKDVLTELAIGLANSGKPFLWVVRPDIVTGGLSGLPDGFLDETKGRGIIVDWCDQERVLGHSAVRGFMSHGGWNSVLESVGNGIPMLLWPFGSEQQTNCWFCCERWGIGMELERDGHSDKVESGVIEASVKELMDGEKGVEMKNKAMEMKKLVDKATQKESGESWLNLNKLVQQILSKCSTGNPSIYNG